MIKDRGTIKWTSMMLTEHVELLKKWNQEAQFIQKPSLTSWELEDLQQTIEQAMRTEQPIDLVIWSKGQFSSVIGCIQKVVPERQVLYVDTLTAKKTLTITDIVAARLLDEFDD